LCLGVTQVRTRFLREGGSERPRSVEKHIKGAKTKKEWEEWCEWGHESSMRLWSRRECGDSVALEANPRRSLCLVARSALPPSCRVPHGCRTSAWVGRDGP
jgi:hypothetical protein